MSESEVVEINCLTCGHGPQGRDTCGWPRETGIFDNPPCKHGVEHYYPVGLIEKPQLYRCSKCKREVVVLKSMGDTSLACVSCGVWMWYIGYAGEVVKRKAGQSYKVSEQETKKT